MADAAQWEAWLADHHDRAGGVWLKIATKGSGKSSVTLREALDAALSYGWIDSVRRSYDETHNLLMHSRRRPRSLLSEVNVGKATTLIASGRMRPPGLAAISAARADGRWPAGYDNGRARAPRTPRSMHTQANYASSLRSRPVDYGRPGCRGGAEYPHAVLERQHDQDEYQGAVEHHHHARRPGVRADGWNGRHVQLSAQDVPGVLRRSRWAMLVMTARLITAGPRAGQPTRFGPATGAACPYQEDLQHGP
jgi:hypothetical protein